jgi:hypothetical protein
MHRLDGKYIQSTSYFEQSNGHKNHRLRLSIFLLANIQILFSSLLEKIKRYRQIAKYQANMFLFA